MSNRRFEVTDYRQVLYLMQQKLSDRAIAKRGLMGRNKLSALRCLAAENGWLTPGAELPDDEQLFELFQVPKQNKAGPSSSLEHHRERIKEWVEQGVNGRVIHRVLCESHGYTGSYSSAYRLIKSIKASTPKVTSIMDFEPGDTAQIDFGKGPDIEDPVTGDTQKTWFFVMVLAWSRHMYAELVTDQSVETWLGCHRRAFEHFGGVPRICSVDNLKAAITKACYYDPLVQHSYADYAEGYGFIIAPCPVADPQKKGRVEAGVKYVKNNFAPLRTFRDLVDANQQLMKWVMEVAGTRKHGTTHVAPLKRFDETERCLLQPLPASPPEEARWAKAKVHSDCHIQIQHCRYSVPYQRVSQTVDVRLSETTTRLYRNHKLIATHPRLTKAGQRSTLDEHMPPDHIAFKMRTPAWCLKQAEEVGPYCSALINELFTDGVVQRLRAAQGIIRLRKTYGDTRLDMACRRALAFDNVGYRSVRTILEKSLDQVVDEHGAFDELCSAYTGKSRFCRDTKDLFDPH